MVVFILKIKKYYFNNLAYVIGFIIIISFAKAVNQFVARYEDLGMKYW